MKTDSLNPTTCVFPTRIVGARRFPVGPSKCAGNVSSSGRSFFECVPKPLSPIGGEGRVRGFQDALFIENRTTLLPLATSTTQADSANRSASADPSFALASTTSATSIFFFARNPCAFAQEFHPLRW